MKTFICHKVERQDRLIMNEVALRKCRRQLSWHADSGQLHFTIDRPGGGRRFEVACNVAFLLRNMVCAAGPHFRPDHYMKPRNNT